MIRIRAMMRWYRDSLEVGRENSEVTFSMPYDRDWHVYVDGNRADRKIKDNYLLGCMMGAGSHEVEMKYLPLALYIGIAISLVSVIVCIGVVLRRTEELRISF